MPFLIRWKSEEATVTIRAQRVVTSPVLDDHLRLMGVAGLNDNDHPDLEIHTLDVPKSEVGYMAEAITIENGNEVTPPTAAPIEEPTPPVDDKPEAAIERDTASKSRGRVRRERRARSTKAER